MPLRKVESSGTRLRKVEQDEGERAIAPYLGRRFARGLATGLDSLQSGLPGGAPLPRAFELTGEHGVGIWNQQNIEPRTPTERYGGRMAEFVGASLPFAGRAPLSTSLVGAGQGAVFEGVKDAGGNDLAAAGASMAAPFTPALAATAARGALGGGSRRMAPAIQEASRVPGYQPTAGEAGGGFLTRWLERLGQYSAFSGGATQNRMAATDDALRAAVDDLAGGAEDAAGVARGSSGTAEAAGVAVRRGLRDDANSWLARSRQSARRADAAAARAIEAAEQAQGSPARVNIRPVMDELESLVTRQADLGDLPQQLGDPDVLATLSALDEVAQNGALTFRQAREMRALIGNMTNWSGGAPNRDTALWRRIYGQLSEQIGESVRALPTVRLGQRSVNPASAFRQSQNRWVQHFDRVENFFDPVMLRAAEPDQIASMAMQVTRPTRMRQLRQMVGERRWNQVRAFSLRQMGRSRPSSAEGTIATGDEAFSPLTFATNWNKMKQSGAWDEMFGNAPSNSSWARLKPELDNLASVIGRIQRNRNAIANPSGTANRLIAYQQATSLGGGAAASVLTGNPTILGTILAGQGTIAIGARAMMSPRFVRWLARDTQVPMEQLPAAIARLNTIIDQETNPEAKAEMQAFRDQLQAEATP